MIKRQSKPDPGGSYFFTSLTSIIVYPLLIFNYGCNFPEADMKKIKIPVSLPEGFAVTVTAFVTFVAYRAAYWHMERAEDALTGIAMMFGLMAGVGLYALRVPAVHRELLKQHSYVSLISAALNVLTANILFQGGFKALAATWCAFVVADIISAVFIYRAHAGLLGDLTADPDEDEA